MCVLLRLFFICIHVIMRLRHHDLEILTTKSGLIAIVAQKSEACDQKQTTIPRFLRDNDTSFI